MKPFTFALISSNDHSDIIGTATVYAEDLKKAKDKMRSDPDMRGVRFYPYMGSNNTAKVEPEAVAA